MILNVLFGNIKAGDGHLPWRRGKKCKPQNYFQSLLLHWNGEEFPGYCTHLDLRAQLLSLERSHQHPVGPQKAWKPDSLWYLHIRKPLVGGESPLPTVGPWSNSIYCRGWTFSITWDFHGVSFSHIPHNGVMEFWSLAWVGIDLRRLQWQKSQVGREPHSQEDSLAQSPLWEHLFPSPVWVHPLYLKCFARRDVSGPYKAVTWWQRFFKAFKWSLTQNWRVRSNIELLSLFLSQSSANHWWAIHIFHWNKTVALGL